MSPEAKGTSPQLARGGRFGRLAAIGALILAVIAIAWLLLAGGDDGFTYKMQFETGGQLVEDNEVLIGGQPVGSIDAVELTDDGTAEVTVTVSEQLHEGTSAVIRSTSLSGIANRYISITPGPDNAPELENGQVITQVDTTTPVDLDQLFNTFDEPTRKALQDVIAGQAQIYSGKGPEANETYRYLSPGLTAATNLFREVNRDERVLTDFLVNGSRVVSAVAERRDDLAGLVTNSNQALGAVAVRNREFDRALKALPPAIRQANTTFFNLRPTLDDLDPFVAATAKTTDDLPPFLRQFKGVAKKSVPVFHDLSRAVNRKGKNNDLADAAKKFVPLRNAANQAVGPSIAAIQRADPVLRYTRPYIPDLLTAVGKLGQITGYYDAAGHYARVLPAGMGIFCFDEPAPAYPLPAPCNTGSNELRAIPPGPQFDFLGPIGGPNVSVFHRCPGGTTQPIAGSNPFRDGGALVSPAPPGDCTETDVPLGP